jgi:hypothetical protein
VANAIANAIYLEEMGCEGKRKDRGPIWILGVNIYPKTNVLPLSFAPTNICPLGCLDGGENVGGLFI